MNKTNKKLWLAIVLLVILNITTIGTILYHNQQNKQDEIGIVLNENHPPLTGRYFRQTLDFSNDQMDSFRHANRVLQPQANEILFQMDSLKYEMFRELNSSNPSMEQLNKMSELTGRYHADLKKITNEFYLTIKSVCNPSQLQLLEQTFATLYQDETVNARQGMGSGPGRGWGGGYGRGYGRGYGPACNTDSIE